jgi:uncharacterized protein (DUF1810 family)
MLVGPFLFGAARTQQRREERDMADRHDLRRFLEAQDGVFDTALGELRAGRKRTHWMWFIFPQMRGLGVSAAADFYGVSSLAEARDYLAHPTLGPRLFACVRAVLDHRDRALRGIFGSPDDLKFRSSMTLFAQAEGDPPNACVVALEQFCEGKPDENTLDLTTRRAV